MLERKKMEGQNLKKKIEEKKQQQSINKRKEMHEINHMGNKKKKSQRTKEREK